MKLIKICLLTIFSFLLFTPSLFSKASTNLDSNLTHRGYPDVVLEKLSPTLKEYLLNEDNLIFLDSSLSSSSTSINHPKLDWVYSAVYAENNKIELIDVIYLYEWEKLPLWRLQDKISVSWEKEDFSVKTDSFVKVDLYDTLTTTANIHSFEPGYAQASAINIYWYANLKGNYFTFVTKLYGYAQFQLVPNQSVVSEVPILIAQYNHDTLIK